MLTSTTSSQSASVKSTLSARRMVPALLTRMSKPAPPNTSRAAIGSAKSKVRLSAEPPAAAIRATVSSQLRRPAQTTCAPCPASVTAMALPIPALAPVTSALRPSSEKRPVIAWPPSMARSMARSSGRKADARKDDLGAWGGSFASCRPGVPYRGRLVLFVKKVNDHRQKRTSPRNEAPDWLPGIARNHWQIQSAPYKWRPTFVVRSVQYLKTKNRFTNRFTTCRI